VVVGVISVAAHAVVPERVACGDDDVPRGGGSTSDPCLGSSSWWLVCVLCGAVALLPCTWSSRGGSRATVHVSSSSYAALQCSVCMQASCNFATILATTSVTRRSCSCKNGTRSGRRQRARSY
jgi:hypothetical protein